MFRSGVTAVWFIEALKSQDFKRKIETKSVEQNALKGSIIDLNSTFYPNDFKYVFLMCIFKTEELDIFHNILKYWLVKTLRIPISSIGK